MDPGRSFVELSNRQLFDLVYRHMRSLAGAAAPDLDDLVQSAAEQVFRSRAAFQGRCELTTWVYSIAYRVLLNHRRWYKRWSLRFCLAHDELEATSQDPLAPSMIASRERLFQLHRAIAKMSDKYRVVVVLHDLDEQPVEVIATIVNANPNTVRSRLRDGRKQLVRLLNLDAAPDPLGDPGEFLATCSQ